MSACREILPFATKSPESPRGTSPTPYARQSSHVRDNMLKWSSLVMLIAQNSGLFIMLRLSRAAHEDVYAGTVAVLIVELLKLLLSFALFASEFGGDLVSTCRELWKSRGSLIVLSIPALCYMLQQNLLFVAADSLSAPALQAHIARQLLQLLTCDGRPGHPSLWWCEASRGF